MEYLWLEEAIRLESMGCTEKSLDIIFNNLDDWLCDRHFDRCLLFLGDVVVSELSTDQLLAILTATLQARIYLPERTLFVDRVRRELDYRQENTKRLLFGLI